MKAADIAQFLQARIPSCSGWSEGVMVPWVEWYMRNKLIGVIVDQDKNITAVGMARPTDDPIKSKTQTYYQNPQGDTVWVDMVAASNFEAVRLLWKIMIKLFGTKRKYYASMKSRYSREIRIRPYARMTKKLLEKNYEPSV